MHLEGVSQTAVLLSNAVAAGAAAAAVCMLCLPALVPTSLRDACRPGGSWGGFPCSRVSRGYVPGSWFTPVLGNVRLAPLWRLYATCLCVLGCCCCNVLSPIRLCAYPRLNADQQFLQKLGRMRCA
jgi:hypothetical protein